ncbi:NAD(P)/FAD-dependent oxidoreductase [Streptomyces rapamycinicus]|uniref:FAD dependent oxidoreductase n=2 Tax=Streptomyces rapamycinicus TaxID=1226757 RepID=A0A0A0N646_STRRN|nr:FAD-dependent oxidoreductase [Streptomyces rapamycinicus]AGP54687.1 FAD-dependent oxidoreductase [Streptomyces rapamycinicus NRRL 5491]MBB4782204.1 glycine/D-amino acid oxidase-like deaminating enzyme [Streptomyces rapamycinicus]RLV82312.1 FAD dependent oxidoreductase [Streptomyces rapamycinicus NRRL 5491]UTO62736.1 FAD-binding oxidoreductase [Streptomyces rapamycinicus]UTP30694.1 FAD-binding oxidoreductase [Streptomyces rapamycinicus NRRL 5491]
MATDAMTRSSGGEGAPTPSAWKALAGAAYRPYWLDDPGRPGPRPALVGEEQCDLLVVGGGYSGLWTALIAKERDPGREVVLVEGQEIGWAASGRNGGFCAASLTHGLGNGAARWPDELAELERLGHHNLDAIESAVERYGIDCDFERTGEIDVATEPYQVAELREAAQLAAEIGVGEQEFLDRDAVRAEVDSPTFLAGLWDRRGVAMLHPAKLAWGLARACAELGVRIYEHTPAARLAGAGAAMDVRTPYGRVRARQVALATNAFPALVRRVRPYVTPVYDHALMTEPLNQEQLDAIGWRGRQGLSDTANHFHYFRLTADQRILWGGYDIVYRYGGRVRAEYDHHPATYRTLAQHFFRCFPQLEGVRFSHAWGGAIDTCSRFSAFFGSAHGGRVAYALGYTGLGVGATRFGAEVMLDLLAGERTERTRLEMVRSKPLPFPPEPVRWAGIGITQWSMTRADENGGRRNLWLKAMDKVGLGFDS